MREQYVKKSFAVALASVCFFQIGPSRASVDLSSHWREEWHEAASLEDEHPEEAATAYQKAAEYAEKANAPIKKQLAILANYGQHLFNNYRFKEAKEVYLRGTKLAQTNGLKEWQALFLLRIGFVDRYLFTTEQIARRDPAPLLEALKLRPGDPTIPTHFRASCYLALSDAYVDAKNYLEADKYLTLAANEFAQIGNLPHNIRKITSDKIALLVYLSKFNDAAALVAKSSKTEPASEYYYRSAYREALKTINNEQAAVKNVTLSLLNKKQFAELDNYAQKQRLSTQCYANGSYPIDTVIDTITDIPNEGDESEWKNRSNMIRQWRFSKPESHTARVALADLLVNYAWHARGSGWAHTVTDEGWKLMSSRLQEALELLQGASEAGPDWYRPATRVALGQSWERKQYDKLIAECQKQYPKYYPIVFAKVYWLLPRWYGEKGESELYAQSEANKIGGVDGDVLYARCAWRQDTFYTNIFRESAFDWNRVKRGFLKIIQDYPNSSAARGEFAILALEAGDNEAATRAFQSSVQKK